MPSFLNANNLQPFVDEEVMEWTRLIEYKDLNGGIKAGYNAKLLRGICKVYLDARNAGKLLKTQEKTAIVAEKILYALADRGIESLVDRASGYNWDLFTQMVNRAFPRYGQTLELDFAINYDKQLSDLEVNSEPLSSHNKALNTALNYNPKEDKG